MARIVAVDIFRVDYRLRHPSVVAYESLETAPNVAVRIELDSGEVGWGNAAPDEHVTGETAETVERTLREVFGPILPGAEASDIAAIWQTLRALAPAEPAALAAIDIALHDLQARAVGLPLVSMLKWNRQHRDTVRWNRREIPTTVTLSIDTMAANIARTRDYLAEGFRALKIKCGNDPEADIERIRAIRREAGSGIKLTLDANQGYDVETTLRVIDALSDCAIDFIEQPVPATNLAALAEICARSPIPVMADESILGVDDVLATPAPLINLKLMKMGGLTGAMQCNAAAESRGIGTMIGCMDESRISMAAAAHLALALSNVVSADLDGHIDIIDDMASEGIIIESGNVTVTDRPGLGVVVNDRR